MIKRSKPLIGITPDVQDAAANDSTEKGEAVFFLRARYASAILQAGGIPVILPISSSRTRIRESLDRLSGVVVTGGNFDIHPRHYRETPGEELGNIKEDRTSFELEVISYALKKDLPLLGICGGTQAINVVLGGSLYQHIARQIPGATNHEKSALKETGGHKVHIKAGTKLKRIVRRDSIDVNTTHHQSIKNLGRSLIVNAVAGDGVVEGIESRDHSFVLGLQWHPEFLTRRSIAQKKIFTAFIRACERY
ncbi:MAG: gamma-glutamyl-gamma-aminobutyrate hydrolase family protein [Deltaproteobacteria bacterium]|nr:gamma-glutamyl-gamma-aminobutyrate hydrolase family protein [Deltaproteobacteria bacterium]